MAPKATPSITLYRGFPRTGNCYAWSAFVTKVEARLRFAGIPYSVEAGSLSKAPRGKIPYMKLSSPESGVETEIPDSSLIISTLVEDGVLPDINARLSPVEKARDLGVRALLEDKLYFVQVYERWNGNNYYTMRSNVLGNLPYPMQVIIGLLAHRGVMRTLHGQGMARYTDEERAALCLEVWENVNALLAEARKKQSGGQDSDSPFWVSGDDDNGPTEADAVLFGFISSSLSCAAAVESQQVIRGFPMLMDYAKRIHDRYFPEYEFWDTRK